MSSSPSKTWPFVKSPIAVARDQPAANRIRRSPASVEFGLEDVVGRLERFRSLDGVDDRQHQSFLATPLSPRQGGRARVMGSFGTPLAEYGYVVVSLFRWITQEQRHRRDDRPRRGPVVGPLYSREAQKLSIKSGICRIEAMGRKIRAHHVPTASETPYRIRAGGPSSLTSAPPRDPGGGLRFTGPIKSVPACE
jgi:hypothetical protein